MLSDIKLTCKSLPENIDDIETVSDIFTYGIPIFDFYIYNAIKTHTKRKISEIKSLKFVNENSVENYKNFQD